MSELHEPGSDERGSSTEPVGWSTGNGNVPAVPIAPERRRFWDRGGLSARAERRWSIAGGVVLALLAIGWGWSLTHAKEIVETSNGEVAQPGAVGTVAAALTNRNAPSAAYLTNAALDLLAQRILASQLGTSHKLRAAFRTGGGIQPDTLPPGARLEYTQNGDTASAPTRSGVWNLILTVGNAIRPVSDFSVITMLPFSAKQNGRIGNYMIGSWPSEHGAKGPPRAPSDRYANPPGFIEVTPQNLKTPVSEHFKLGDFLTHDQPNTWPKYLVLQPRLIDKLELILADLEQHGIETKGVRVMSGFRTPQYNAHGGETAGRAGLSRHMYGDASDIFIDNNGDGVMDDLNHDGRIDINDSGVILAAEDRVEKAHPELIGGGGLYRAAPGHGPFIHIDTRGYRARW
jgi:hypothetical protein